MTFTRIRPRIAVAAAALAGLAFAASTSAAGAESAGKQGSQRLVVRGDATVVDNPTCEGGVCELQLVGGKFRGTPVGTGAYEGAMKLKLTEAFENGEGGGCAPIRGQIVLGAGSPDRLVLAVAGDSCQDGAGPLTASCSRASPASSSSTAPGRTPAPAVPGWRLSWRTPRTTTE
jgi:hypothetical protein